MAITDAQQARQMYYAGGSPADTHNQPGGSGGAPDSVTGGDNDYYDPRFQTVVSQSPSQIGRGPYDDTQSNRLSNFIDKVGGGIGNVSNYYTNSANQKGILGTLLGSMFFGPLGGILGGMYGRGMFKNPFTVTTDDSITQDSNLIDPRFMGSQGWGITSNLLPKDKPVKSGESPFPDISNLVAGLTEKQKELLDQRKNMLDALGPEAILDTIKEDDDPNDPATLQDVKEYYGIV
tara:strand:- start:50 stop:751 length:702 start_codon:yes stop_codon:yes gene_type:complete